MLKLLLTTMAGRLMAPDQSQGAGGGPGLPDDHTVHTSAQTDADAQTATQVNEALQAGNIAQARAAIEQADAERTERLMAQDAGAGQVNEELEARRAEAERQREAFPDQIVRVEAMTHELGMVVQRFQGGFEAHEIKPRHGRQVTLRPGDSIGVVVLQGNDREEYMRIAGMCQSGPAS